MRAKDWSLGRGGVYYLLPDEKKLYTVVRQRIPRYNSFGHGEAVDAGRKLLQRLVFVRRRVAQQLRNALKAHHQLIALERDEECPDCEMTEEEVRNVKGI